MTSNFYNYVSVFFIVVLIAACGSNEQQPDKQQTQQQKEQSKKDSIAQAKADSIAKARSDSLAQSKKKKKQKQEDKLTLEDISFNSSGAFSVQVEAWRSKDKAQSQVSKWKKRGFSNAYVVKAGNEATGNVWFRVRLGRVDNKKTAQKLAKLIRQQYNEKTWISEAKVGT